MLWLAQGGLTWVAAKISGPAGLTVYDGGIGGCVPQYTDTTLDDLKRDPDTARKGVPVFDGQHDPVELPLTLQARSARPEQLGLCFDPRGRDVRFTVEVEWVADGQYGSKVLDNRGLGYRVMAKGGLPTHPEAALYR